jgi:hypothetical protein
MSSTQEVGEIFGEGSGPAHAMLRSPTVLIASVGLWGLNILVFRIFRINYVKVFKHDLKKLKAEEERDDDQDSDTPALHSKKTSESSATPVEELDDENDHSHPHHLDSTGAPVNDAITWNRLVSFSASLLFLLHFTTYIWMEVLGGGFIGAIFSFYGSVITVLLLPIPSLAWLRKGCAITFQRTFELINPRCHCLTADACAIPRPIPFVDVYFADAMCSLSKVFFDMGMVSHPNRLDHRSRDGLRRRNQRCVLLGLTIHCCLSIILAAAAHAFTLSRASKVMIAATKSSEAVHLM